MSNIKNYCVSCGDKIVKSKKRYERIGNFCDFCSRRINSKVAWRIVNQEVVNLANAIQKATEEGWQKVDMKNRKLTFKDARKRLERKRALLYDKTSYIWRQFEINMIEDSKKFGELDAVLNELDDIFEQKYIPTEEQIDDQPADLENLITCFEENTEKMDVIGHQKPLSPSLNTTPTP